MDKKFLLSIAMWQDSLLQNYRLIFISSQSILFPLSALILVDFWRYYLSKGYSIPFPALPTLYIMIPLIIAGFGILYFWKKVTYSRGLDVSYWQMQLLKYEWYMGKQLFGRELRTPFISFKKDWQDGKTQQEKKEELNSFEKKMLIDITRKRMEIYIPSIFYILWIFIFAFMIYYFIISIIPVIVGIIFGFTIFYYRLLTDC